MDDTLVNIQGNVSLILFWTFVVYLSFDNKNVISVLQ